MSSSGSNQVPVSAAGAMTEAKSSLKQVLRQRKSAWSAKPPAYAAEQREHSEHAGKCQIDSEAQQWEPWIGALNLTGSITYRLVASISTGSTAGEPLPT